MDKYASLKKALHRAIGKALQNGNKTVMKALDGMPDRAGTLKRVMADLDDNNDKAQVPETSNSVSGGEAVMNKEVDPQKEVNQTLKGIQHQKEQNAKAAVGQLVEERDPQNTIQMSEESQATKGVHKLKSFMSNRLTKTQEKGVHNPNKLAQEVGLGNGHSTAGMMTAHAKANKTSSARESNLQDAKTEHRKVLKELKAMPKPNLTKTQGKRDESPDARNKSMDRLFNGHKNNEKGVHQPFSNKGGESKAGNSVREAKANSNKPSQFHEGKRDRAKDAHKARLEELKAMPKPNLTKGRVHSDMDHGSKKGPEGYSKYQEQAQNQKGVHTPVSGVTGFPNGKGTSAAGDMSTQTYGGKPLKELRDHGKEMHRKKLAELKAMPKPNLTKAGTKADHYVDYASHDEYLPRLDHKQKKNHKEIGRRLEVLRSSTSPQSRADHAVLERLSTLEHPSDRHMVQEAQWHLKKSDSSK